MKHKKIFTIFILSFLFLGVISSWAGQFNKIQKKYQVNIREELTVYIEIDAGEITISRNNKLGEISVSGRINEKYDNLDIGYDKRHNEFSLTMDRRKWFKSIKDDNASKIEVELPDNVVIDLSGKIKAGKTDFNLGGLSLKNFELRNFAGEVNVDFNQPNKIEMNSLDINVKIGETRLRRLGNARFSDGNINGGIGELNIDLLGEETKSSEVKIDLDIGSTSIFLPRNLGIKLKSSTMGFLTDTNLDSEFDKRGRYYYSNNYDSASKTMYVVIHSGIGELKVELR